MKLVFSAARALSVATLAACVATPDPGVRPANAVDVAFATGAAAHELGRAQADDVLLAWKLAMVGDRARFLVCTSENECGVRRAEVPAASILAVKRVNRIRAIGEDGSLQDGDVVRLTIARGTQLSRGGVAIDAPQGIVSSAPQVLTPGP